MQEVALLAGAGWLRAINFGSSTAEYQLSVRRGDAGHGELIAHGTLGSDVATMIEVQSAGRGVLVLANGEAVTIALTRSGPGRADFTVIGDARALCH